MLAARLDRHYCYSDQLHSLRHQNVTAPLLQQKDFNAVEEQQENTQKISQNANAMQFRIVGHKSVRSQIKRPFHLIWNVGLTIILTMIDV